MQPLRYCINVTLDGCVHHEAGIVDEAMHRHHTETIARSDGIVLGRITYGMMEAGWRAVAESGKRPDGMPAWMFPFAEMIHAVKKYVVSSTLEHADWHNTEIVRGDLLTAITELKARPGRGLALGGVQLPLAIAELGLIDSYEFVVHPRLAGHGPTLFGGLTKPIDLVLVDRTELTSGIVSQRYEPRRVPRGAE